MLEEKTIGHKPCLNLDAMIHRSQGYRRADNMLQRRKTFFTFLLLLKLIFFLVSRRWRETTQNFTGRKKNIS